MELEPREGLTVAELIDMLSHHPGDAIVELSIIAPIKEGDDDITVDRYNVDGVMPWNDEEGDEGVVWLIGGEDADVDLFIDAIEQPDDHDHDHDGHDHEGHDHDHDHDHQGHDHEGHDHEGHDHG